MKWDKNQYYPLIKAGKEAVQCTTALLQAYPLTQACLESLGDQLLKSLEFGFFTGGQQIMLQGKPGKDIFLLCQGQVDVLVDEQLVVKMEAPMLLGDKALVQMDSKRAATIQSAENQTTLWIKIPMGRFIRSFTNSKIPDNQFKQEVSIFSYLFQGIQQRLFGFIYLQKNLWEEMTTNLQVANEEVIANVIDTKINLHWSEDIWKVITFWLSKNINFKWPSSVPLNSDTFRGGLWQFLEFRFPKNKFEGPDDEYLSYKDALWKTWLSQISRQIISLLPEADLPVQIQDLDMFNPRNYHLRISRVLRGVESKFEMKNDNRTPTEKQKASKNEKSINRFFGSGKHSNEFQLQQYLEFFEETFEAKHANRVQAQIAQRIAIIAAECENQFNASIVKMQQFLEVALKKYASETSSNQMKKQQGKELHKIFELILKGFEGYEKKFVGRSFQERNQIRAGAGINPNLKQLLANTPIPALRSDIKQAYGQLLEVLGLYDKMLLKEFREEFIYLCKAYKDHIAPPYEMIKHYWIPVSPGMTLKVKGLPIGPLLPGTLIPSAGWPDPNSKKEFDCSLEMAPLGVAENPKEHPQLILVMTPSLFAWSKEPKPHAEVFVRQYLPLMQWMTNQYIASVQTLVKQRGSLYQTWFELERVIWLEKKVQGFENSALVINTLQQEHLQVLLQNSLGMHLEKKASYHSDQLAKKIYNHIIRQMGKDHPEMEVEDRSNKAYTKWRYILSEIIKALERLDSGDDDFQGFSPKPIWEILTSQLEKAIQPMIEDGKKFIQFSREAPNFAIGAMMKRNLDKADCEPMVSLYKEITSIFEKAILDVLLELQMAQTRIEMLNQGRVQVNPEDLQTEIIEENIEKLANLLNLPSDLEEYADNAMDTFRDILN